MIAQKTVIVSGFQPTGEIHIGNYLGALKNFVELQKTHECYFFIADLHSLTESFTPQDKKKQIVELAADFLAMGLDPKQCALFIQSHIPAHAEFTWILNCLAPYAELKRMTQFKDKSEHDPGNINMGLLDYPVLQAADILLYNPHAVPVGKDQIQHLELTRKLTRTFNKRFGKMFTEPKPLLTETLNIKSLTNPDKKMSKSHGKESYIALQDEPKTIQKKFARAVTDTGPQTKTMSPGVENLFLLLKHFSTETIYHKYKKLYDNKTIQYQPLKKQLADDIANYFKPYRKRKKKLLTNPDAVLKVYSKGARKAGKRANKTLTEVKQKIGLV